MDHVPPERQHDADGRGPGRDVALFPPARRPLARLALPAALSLAAVVFLALGAWQLERRAWKLDLIARVEARLAAPPAALPPPAAWPGLDGRDGAYRRLRARGVLLHDAEALVQAVTDLGPGYWVMTPLRAAEGVLLVNRGFVPPERRARASRAEGLTPGEVEVAGLLRASEPGGGFLRANDPAADRWHSRDVAAIAGARGLAGVAPFFLDADAAPVPGGWPRGGLTVVAFRNTHLVYALTWFALAAGSLAGLALVLRARA